MSMSVERLRLSWGWLKGSVLLQFTVVFAVIALVLSLATGFAVSSFVALDIHGKTLDSVASETSEVTAGQISDQLSPDLLATPLNGEDRQTFDSFVHANILSSRIVRVNV